ncbi:hypothetical protein PS2_038197 [Malus domestica]
MDKSPYIHRIRWHGSLAKLTFWSFVFLGMILIFFFRSPSSNSLPSDPSRCSLRTIPYSDHQRWWSAETVAVVTRGNMGIGFEISKQLAAHEVIVILTSRDRNVGLEAVKVFQEGGLNMFFHQLDVLDTVSIAEFCDWLKENYSGLDILACKFAKEIALKNGPIIFEMGIYKSLYV